MTEINQHGDHTASCFCCEHIDPYMEGGYDCQSDCSLECRCQKGHFHLSDLEVPNILHELVRRGMGCSDFEGIEVEPSFEVVQRAYDIENSREVRKYNKAHLDEVKIMEWSQRRAFNQVILDEGVSLAKKYCDGLGVKCPLIFVYCYGTRYRVSVTPGHLAGAGRWDFKDGNWERVEGTWKSAVADFTGFLSKDPGVR